MTELTEGVHAWGFVLSEANGNRSRENVTILSGEAVVPGQVLGHQDVGTASATAGAGNTGDGAMGAITVTDAKFGDYQLNFIEEGADAGKFLVEDPDGITVGVAEVGVAFSDGGLAFTLADGATDFDTGDSFVITVAAGSGKYVALDLTDTDGGQYAQAILGSDVDASAADAAAAALVRDAEVLGEELTWPDGITADQKTAAIAELAALGILVR